MFFSMFILFIVLIVGPIIASKFIDVNLDIMDLQQPSTWYNNDTTNSQTGTAVAGAAATTAAAVRRAYFTYDT